MDKNIKNKLIIVSLFSVLIFSACSKADTVDKGSGHSDNQIQNRNTDTGDYGGGTDKEVSAAESNKKTNGYVTLAEASTRILDRSENRVHNIKLACKKLKAIVIESGMEFSFNQVVGERNAENGYKEAPALLYEDRITDVGGGVCQVSSTIYQAVLNAGLEVTERNAHKKQVDYTEKNLDACVEYGKLDFKFRNNTDKSIVLKVSTDGKYVFSSIETNL